jgi:glucose-6-phosphate 1-dehydrogenase
MPQDMPDQRPSNRVLILFGATGDLAKRKLFPGFFHLYREGLMPRNFRIIGSGRHSPGSDDDFRAMVKEAVRDHGRGELDEHWPDFALRLSFVGSSAEDGEDLARAVTDAEAEVDAEGERLVYLSVPPGAMLGMVEMLGRTGIAEHCSLVVEKPFGHDAKSACELNAALHKVLDESSIYRIDHFLGKEAAQNILALRFANGMFEPIWNRDHINYIQIDVPEALDIQGRAGFYEQTGAFRDMVVTHLLQILGIVALEPPTCIDADGLHVERTKVFDAIRPLDRDRVVFGQYEGYRDEEGVAPDSRVETFAALEVWVDTWRWSGVPFYLRTGKAMAQGRRTVTIGLTDAPLRIFPHQDPGKLVRPSELVFELSDDPEVKIEVQAKVPGPAIKLGRAALALDVDQAFGGVDGLEAYERLLHDVMLQDRLLFTRAEQIERLWEVCAPVIEQPPPPQPYPPGSWGPDVALKLPCGPGWRLPDNEAGAAAQARAVQPALRSHSSAASSGVAVAEGSVRREST